VFPLSHWLWLRRAARSRRALALCALAGPVLAGLPAPGPAAAAEPEAEPGPGAGAAPAPPPGIEEIVIIGEKRAGLVAEQAVSVTSFDAETIKVLGAQDFSDLARVTPSLEINTISASAPTFYIRGVGLNDFAANAAGAVAIYQDGVPINAPALQLGQLFDLEGADVLRGPQTTGGERNASAGMIRANARRPTGDFASTLRLDYGRFASRDAEGALALPLSEGGELSTRIAFRYADRDPYTGNGCGKLAAPQRGACGASPLTGAESVPAGLPDEVGDRKRWALRSVFRLQPSDSDSDWLFNLHGAEIDQDAELGQVIGTGGISNNILTQSGYSDPAIQAIYDAIDQRLRSQGVPRQGPNGSLAQAKRATLKMVTDDIGLAQPYANDYNLVGQEELKSLGGSLRGQLYLGGLRLETISGVESYDRENLSDFDFSSNTAIHSGSHDYARQITQSLQLESELERIPLTWRLGGYFLTEKLDSDSTFVFNFQRGGSRQFNQVTQRDYTQDLYSTGAFGNFEWEFHDHFTLSGGARFNWERKAFDIALSTFEINGTSADSKVWMAPTGAIVLSYRPSDEAEIYSKFSRGWKPGLFNAAAFKQRPDGSPAIEVTDPEQIDAFEIGSSASWFDGALESRAALFYYKYRDYQVFLLDETFGNAPEFAIINVKKAQIYGAELDLFATPLRGWAPLLLEGLSLELRAGWLESKALDFTRLRRNNFGVIAVTEVLDFSGNRLPNTPRFKASGSVWIPFELGRFGTLTPRYDVSYTDDVFFDPSQGVGTDSDPLPKYGIGQKAYLLHNLRLSHQLPGEQIEIAGWVRNLTDEKYKRYAAEVRALQSVLNWIGEPRTYGFSIGFEW